MSYDSDTSPPQPNLATSTTGEQAPLLGRLGRLVLKELREVFRDRRTIITLIVMPVLIYPLLALVFQRFLLTSLTSSDGLIYTLGVESELDHRNLQHQIDPLANLPAKDTANDPAGRGPAFAARLAAKLDAADKSDVPAGLNWFQIPAADMERRVGDGDLNLGVIAHQQGGATSEPGLATPLQWELIYRPGSEPSEKALRFVESRLMAWNEAQLHEQLRGHSVTAILPAAFSHRATQPTGAPTNSLAALIPLILVLTTVTGAVYPAIDLTAGERERGTLEMLIAAPVPRLGLLLAKYVAVLAVAIVTAGVNLAGMTVTAKTTGLATLLFPTASMGPLVIFRVGLLLCLLAAFFSAVLLAITSLAKSFKEAQAYIIPLMLVCLVPGILCLLPSLEFSGVLAVTPLMNIVMLARDVLDDNVSPPLAAAAIVSTLIYIAAALALAARIFGTDAVLYGSPATWSDFVRRPTSEQSLLTPSAAAFALTVMFPTYFILSGILGQRDRSSSMSQFVVLSVLITVLIFLAFPLAIASFHRVRLSTGLGLRPASWLTFFSALILGVSLWPFAYEALLLNRVFGTTNLSQAYLELVRQQAEKLRQLSPAFVLFAYGVVPGICEEFFFRGFLFGGLRKRLTGWGTVAAVAFIFGFFHVVSGNAFQPDRFLPTAFLGLALGWVRLRSGSVLPCMLLHAAHNTLLLSMNYWPADESPTGYGLDANLHLPATWLIIASLGVLFGAAMLRISPARSDATSSSR